MDFYDDFVVVVSDGRGDSWCDSLEDCARGKRMPIRMRCHEEDKPNGNIVKQHVVRCAEIQKMRRFFTDKWYEESYKRFMFEAFQSALYDKIKQDRMGWEKALGKGIGLW